MSPVSNKTGADKIVNATKSLLIEKQNYLSMTRRSDGRVVQRLGGGERGCHNFVPVSGGDGTKIASPGDILYQPPGKMR